MMRKYVFVLAMLLLAGCSEKRIEVEVVSVRYDTNVNRGGETFYRTADGATGSLNGVWGQPGDMIYPKPRYVVGE